MVSGSPRMSAPRRSLVKWQRGREGHRRGSPAAGLVHADTEFLWGPTDKHVSISWLTGFPDAGDGWCCGDRTGAPRQRLEDVGNVSTLWGGVRVRGGRGHCTDGVPVHPGRGLHMLPRNVCSGSRTGTSGHAWNCACRTPDVGCRVVDGVPASHERACLLLARRGV